MLRMPLTLIVTLGAILPVAARGQSPTADTGLSGLGGPPVAGVCMLSREDVFLNAKVGQAAAARLKTLAETAQAEVNGERAQLDADAKALEGQKASLPAAQFQARQQALAPRLAAIQQKAQLRSREMEATRTKALAAIAEQSQPLIAQAYQGHHCGMLLNRDAVLGGNASADLTPLVIKALDDKITTMTFDRETLASAPAAPGTVKR